MEVQADVSASETASAVTCVSEKSSNTLNDNASTRALAGSMYKQVNLANDRFNRKKSKNEFQINRINFPQHMDSSNVSEDGASERVRFDNTIYYAIDKESIDKVSRKEIALY